MIKASGPRDHLLGSKKKKRRNPSNTEERRIKRHISEQVISQLKDLDIRGNESRRSSSRIINPFERSSVGESIVSLPSPARKKRPPFELFPNPGEIETPVEKKHSPRLFGLHDTSGLTISALTIPKHDSSARRWDNIVEEDDEEEEEPEVFPKPDSIPLTLTPRRLLASLHSKPVLPLPPPPPEANCMALVPYTPPGQVILDSLVRASREEIMCDEAGDERL
jgi:hypothetical protein